MLNPPIESLVKKVNSKYALVIGTAKRARQIVATKKQSVLDTRKAVSIALTEILEDRVKIVRPDELDTQGAAGTATPDGASGRVTSEPGGI